MLKIVHDAITGAVFIDLPPSAFVRKKCLNYAVSFALLFAARPWRVS